MSCIQTLSGLAKDCASNMGGIVEVYIANYDEVESKTTDNGIVDAITMVTGKKFHRYSFAKNTGSMTSTYTIDGASGVKFVTTDLVLQFNRMQTLARIEISALASADAVVIVKDCNGKYWYLGFDEPVMLSAGDGQTGTQRSDANRYQITLQDNSHELPYEVDEDIIAALIA